MLNVRAFFLIACLIFFSVIKGELFFQGYQKNIVNIGPDIEEQDRWIRVKLHNSESGKGHIDNQEKYEIIFKVSNKGSFQHEKFKEERVGIRALKIATVGNARSLDPFGQGQELELDNNGEASYTLDLKHYLSPSNSKNTSDYYFWIGVVLASCEELNISGDYSIDLDLNISNKSKKIKKQTIHIDASAEYGETSFFAIEDERTIFKDPLKLSKSTLGNCERVATCLIKSNHEKGFDINFDFSNGGNFKHERSSAALIPISEIEFVPSPVNNGVIGFEGYDKLRGSFRRGFKLKVNSHKISRATYLKGDPFGNNGALFDLKLGWDGEGNYLAGNYKEVLTITFSAH